MKAITKRFLAVFLSLMIVIAPTIQQANAASGWTVTDVKNTGGRVIVTATKGGYKSAVNISPSAARLALKLAKGANWAALLYAAIEAAPDLADIESFQPDYSNNRVKYQIPNSADSKYFWGYAVNQATYPTIEAAGMAGCLASGFTYVSHTKWSEFGAHVTCRMPNGSTRVINVDAGANPNYSPTVEEYISISALAPQVAKNTAHAPSQQAVAETAIEMVVAGDFDKDLLGGAVPINDSRPLIPAVPISGNGNVASGDMTGGDVGKAADDARKAADDARKAAQAAADVYRDAAEAARIAADDAQSVINSAVDQAIKDIAAATAAAAEKAAADSKAVADTAAATAAEKAAESVRAAERVYSDALAAVETATAENKAAAVAAAEKAAESVKAAEKSAEKAKAESAKPFELPAFCTWAAIVCETAEWLKREPETPEITAIDTDSPIDDFDSDKSYITFTGSCPPKYTASLSIMGATAPFEFDYTPICTVMSYLKPFIVGAGYIAAAYIIAGHSRGSKD